MRKTTMWKALGAAMVLGIAVAMAVPAETLNRTIALLTGAASGPTSDYEVIVDLSYNGSQSYTFKASLDRSEFSRAESSPEQARVQYGARAREALARKLGYGTRTFGQDNAKVVNASINHVRIRDTRSGRTTDIFRSARYGGSEFTGTD